MILHWSITDKEKKTLFAVSSDWIFCLIVLFNYSDWEFWQFVQLWCTIVWSALVSDHRMAGPGEQLKSNYPDNIGTQGLEGSSYFMKRELQQLREQMANKGGRLKGGCRMENITGNNHDIFWYFIKLSLISNSSAGEPATTNLFTLHSYIFKEKVNTISINKSL